LQEGILQKLNRDEVERSRAFECALQALRRVIPQASYLIQAEPLKWKETEPHLPQLLSLRRAFSRSTPRIQASVSFAQLLYDVGMNMWDRGLADDGQKVLTTAEEILDAVRIPQEHILRANINLVLSLFGEDVGISCRRETLQRRERALNIRQSLWDATPLDQRSHDDEVLIYAAIVDLACSYQQYNNYDKVRELIEASLKKYHEWGNHDTIPFEFAKYYRLDAYAHIFEGDTKAAVQSMKKAAELQAMADPTALMANFFQCDWAIMLAQNGQWDEAIGRLHAICEYRETTCGKLSVLTLQAHLILGIFYFHQKQYDNAL
jgi:tetratricopeptide (TPR) repeat protein